MNKFYFLFLSVILYSCFTPRHLDYLGTSFPRTQKVDVYVDVSAIKKPYTIMGKTYVDLYGLINVEKVQDAAIEKAKQKGADAILFEDYIVENGSTIETITKSDSTGLHPVRIRTTTSTPNETRRLDILFLKYD